MKLERFTVQACCGGTAIMFKTSEPITKEVLTALVGCGFRESVHFTKAGILYADNLDFIVSGPFGSTKLQVKCRKKDKQECEKKLSDFEALLLTLG